MDARARAWLDRKGCLTPSTTTPGDGNLITSLAALLCAVRKEERERIKEFIELEIDPARKSEREQCAREILEWNRFGSGRNDCRALAKAIRGRML